MRFSRILAGLLALVTAVFVVGCSAEGSDQRLPGASTLLDAAAASIADIDSAHVSLRTTGEISELRVRSLGGDLTRKGDKVAAQGSGKMRVMGQTVSVDFVFTGGTLYVKGPTGSGYQKIPAALSSSIPNPAALLDPKRGIGKVLHSVRGAKTVAKEKVQGTPTFKVAGSVPEKVLGGLLPGISSKSDVTFWLAQTDGHRPVKAVVSLPGKKSADGTAPQVTITLSDVNKPVTITPPA